VLEGVFRLGRHAAPEDQFGAHELRQGVVQLLPRHWSDGSDQLVGELTSESSGDLRHVARWRQVIKPRQERRL